MMTGGRRRRRKEGDDEEEEGGGGTQLKKMYSYRPNGACQCIKRRPIFCSFHGNEINACFRL